MSANLTDVTKYFPTVNEGFITAVGGTGISAGANVIPITATSGLVDGSVFVGIIELNTSNQQTFTGTVDVTGSQLTGVVWTRGANVAHAAGVSIVDIVTGTAISMMSKGFLVEHNQDGTHGAMNVTSLTASGAVTAASLTASGNLSVGGRTTNTVSTLASAATLTPNASYNLFECTALAVNTAIAAPTGTPANMQGMMLRIKDNGTSRTISWNAIYRGVGVTLPTATTASKNIYVAMRYNSGDSKWDVLSVGRET